MARPRKQVYTMKQYLDNVNEGDINNDADTQRNPAWKAIVDGLAVTILTDDYIPSIILAEEDSGEIKIVDGGSRTAAFKMIRKGNYKIKSSVENPIIPYKKKTKDDNEKIKWEDTTFDIRNKTFEQFPKELQKKFDEYQVDTVVHEHCNKEKVSMYMKRYNERKNFSASQKQFLYLPVFAERIRDIARKKFFINCCSIKETEKDNGILERVISESVMTIFHFDKWNKNGKKLAIYLNDNATDEQFEKLDKNISRLENIVNDNTKKLFNAKDSFIWIALFDKFLQTGLDDKKFSEFLEKFLDGLRNKSVDGKLFDTVDANGSTKDKSIIAAKLHILETLMNEFLHIGTTETENKNTEESVEDNTEETVLSFVKENANPNATDEDIEAYSDLVDYCFNYNKIKIDAPIYQKCQMALIALMGYACQNENEDNFGQWIKKYQNQTNFSPSQKVNYTYMKRSFDDYIKKNEYIRKQEKICKK